MFFLLKLFYKLVTPEFEDFLKFLYSCDWVTWLRLRCLLGPYGKLWTNFFPHPFMAQARSAWATKTRKEKKSPEDP